MKLFGSKSPVDVIFLEPVRKAGEKLPRGKMRMLCCDAEGKVYASIINSTAYKLAMDSVSKMESKNKDYATLGLEVGPGNFLPLVVEIGPKEVIVLEYILDHARKSGVIPDVLKKELQQIIKLGESGRKGKKAEKGKDALTVTPAATPGVLTRLPYYSEWDIEFSMPIYKASHSYPLIVLDRLLPDKQSPHDDQRLLILDSDGDLAIIKVPLKLIVESEKRLEEWSVKTGMPACIVIGRGTQGLDINYLMISKAQKKALDTMARRFEETGSGEQPVTAAAKKVLIEAKDISAPLID
ncbi:hypothetical protein ACFLU1_03560 [Chloroflexota bacterium]